MQPLSMFVCLFWCLSVSLYVPLLRLFLPWFLLCIFTFFSCLYFSALFPLCLFLFCLSSFSSPSGSLGLLSVPWSSSVCYGSYDLYYLGAAAAAAANEKSSPRCLVIFNHIFYLTWPHQKLRLDLSFGKTSNTCFSLHANTFHGHFFSCKKTFLAWA